MVRRKVGWGTKTKKVETPAPRIKKKVKKKISTKQAAEKSGVDLQFECPVCRELDGCDCEESDRAFMQRTRFEAGIEKVSRCSRCKSPLSVLYIKVAGKSGDDLSHYTASYCCLRCAPQTVAIIAIQSGDKNEGI